MSTLSRFLQALIFILTERKFYEIHQVILHVFFFVWVDKIKTKRGNNVLRLQISAAALRTCDLIQHSPSKRWGNNDKDKNQTKKPLT